jgi:hypothetical protein
MGKKKVNNIVSDDGKGIRINNFRKRRQTS